MAQSDNTQNNLEQNRKPAVKVSDDLAKRLEDIEQEDFEELVAEEGE